MKEEQVSFRPGVIFGGRWRLYHTSSSGDGEAPGTDDLIGAKEIPDWWIKITFLGRSSLLLGQVPWA